MITTMPSDRIPISTHWCMNSFQYIFMFSGFENISLIISIYRPSSVKIFMLIPESTIYFFDLFHQGERAHGFFRCLLCIWFERL